MKDTMKEVVLSFISWALMLALAIAGLAEIAQADAYQLPGDGFEYLMIPVSLVNHGSTDVDQQDIDAAKEYYGNSIFDTIYRDRESITLVKGSDGLYYVKHFGLYSLLCMPLRSLFHVVGMNPAKAFQYMNLLFWVAACLIVQLVLKTEQWKKTLLMVFLVINPAWFYLTWVHTEILIFSLVVVSLVMRHNKRYVIAMLLMSIAAMSNLTLLVPAFLIGVEFLITAYKDNGKKLGITAKKTVPVILAAIPGFIPIIRSYVLFGTYSPVAAVASVSNSIAPSDNRFICGLSYIFDPNQGMIPYTLLIAPVFFVLVVVNLVRRKNILDTVLSIFCIIAMLFIVSQELHINCGMSYIMRYNVWILPFMAFYNVLNLNYKPACAVFGLSGIWTMVVMVIIYAMYPVNLYLDHTFIGRQVLDRFPSLYNPPVGIFYSRTLTQESYYCKFPVPYYDEEGNLRKVLITPEAQALLDNGEWTIYDPSGVPVDFRTLPSTNMNGDCFTYVNLNQSGYHMVREGNVLNFSNLTQTDASLIRSPVGFEGDTALVYGRQFHLCMHMLPGRYVGRFDLANVFGGEQLINVKVNGQTVFERPVTMYDDSFEFTFDVTDDYLCDIVIEIPNAFSPMSVIEGNTDDRILSLYLRNFTYTPE